MEGHRITKIIERNTVGDEVNLKEVAKQMNFKIISIDNMHDFCHLSSNNGKSPVIKLNKNLSKQERFTIVAIAISDFILYPEKTYNDRVVKFDMFSLHDLHIQRYAHRILLATRLTVSEEFIKRLRDDIHMKEINKVKSVTPNFLRCCEPYEGVSFILKEFSLLPTEWAS